MLATPLTYDELWARIERAVEKVKDRMRRFIKALDTAEIPYAVIGGNAVQVWVGQVDESLVRNTRDVDVILKRETLPATIAAVESAGFTFRHTAGLSMFLDGPQSKAGDAVHILFAGERVRPSDPEPIPSIDSFELLQGIRILPLEALVQMKLTANRRKDQVHIQDMLAAGLIDSTWLDRFQSPLRERLQELIDDPHG